MIIMKITIDNLELTNNEQDFFDNFNGFILHKDRRIFNKLIARTMLYQKVKDVPGDIVECGVFKGTGMYTFLKLKYLFNPNSYKKVVGFDFFNTEELLKSITDNKDSEAMTALFEGRDFGHGENYVDIFKTS